MARQRLFLPFGQGLERSSGVMVTQPTRFEDLRNVFLFEGKAQARKGSDRTVTLVDNLTADLDRVLQIHPLRAESAGMAVGFDDTSQEAFVNIMGIDGTGNTVVLSGDTNGRLFLLDPTNTFDPPIVIMEDSARRMYFAHDEPLINARAVTRFYDGSVSPQIQTLQADLDDDGTSADVKFRGVVRFLSYLVGWGWGSETEQDRPDIVRVSLAGDPGLWDPRHFFVAGQRDEPVMTCRQAGAGPRAMLLVFKETETHEIFGYSPETFGIRPADAQFGCVGSRLAVTVGDTVFFWSTQGPRMSRGGESIDIAVPLDIEGPDPATLVAESEPERAFAVYDPSNRVVMFVWGRRVYALSIRNPQQLRWSYYEFGAGAEPSCGAQFFATQSAGGTGSAPVGWPRLGGATIPTAPPPTLPVAGDTTLDLTWENNGGGGAVGNEIVEVWLRDVEGVFGPPNDWSLHASISIDLSGGGPDFTQTFQVTGLLPTREFEVSLRYKANGQFAIGFTAANPQDWTDPACPGPAECPPAYAPGLFTTVSAPSLTTRAGDNGGLWQRTAVSAEQITIPIVIPANHGDLVMEVQRSRATVGDTGVQNIDGMGPGSSSNQSVEGFIVVDAALAAGSTSFTDTGITGEQIHTYRVRFLSPGGGADSSFSNNLACQAGPDPPSGFFGICNSPLVIDCNWANATTPADPRTCPTGLPPNGHRTQGYANNDDDDPAQDNWLERFDVGVGLTTAQMFPPGIAGDDVSFSGRHKTTCFGVEDFSRWSLPGFSTCSLMA